MVYNLMNWFKEMALGYNAKKEMAGTIRWKLFLIPAKLAVSGRKIRLRLADWWPYREEFYKALIALT
ncbi:MAG: transposase [Bacteroidota bacterium]|nr:transposase [Bacteroidota bacterium]